MAEDLIARLFSMPGRGIQTFESMQTLDKRLGFPHRSFPSIHVAGTNGKGSVAAKIAAALEFEGYKTGLYTSPHISSFQERICINGEMIPQGNALAILSSLFAAAENLTLSFFDLITALAFVYFAQEKVDFAVIETGLGGRLDATNVINPILSIITSIGWDHTHLLGDTLEKIAREKEGIVKPNIPLVAGPAAAPFYPYAIQAPPGENAFYDLENQSIAKTALQQLQKQIPISNEAIEKSLQIRPRCRFEIRDRLILDVAHNPDAFKKLIQALEFHFPGRKFPFYTAFSADKDWKQCLEIAHPHASEIFLLNGSYPRLVSPEVIQAQFPTLRTASYEEVKEGVVCGSFYIMNYFNEINNDLL